jgi:polysaccharide chain length determinant protein (PEP-CTERM system associated)
MEQWYPLIRGTLATAWRRRWLLVAAVWAVCIVGWVGVAFIPNSYESRARVYVDTDAILTPLLKGLAINTAPESELRIVQKTLLSGPNLDKVIEATSLNLSATTPERREQMISDLGRSITVAAEGPNLYAISYRNANPRLARDVVAALLNIFMDRITRTNRANIANAQKFLNRQIASVGGQLRAIEGRRAEFLRKYLDILPLERNGGVSLLDGVRQTVTSLETRINNALASRQALQQELQMTPRVIANGATAASRGEGLSPAARLANAKERLAELRTRYTDEEPNVAAARRLVAYLRKEAAHASRSASGTRSAALTNPVYEKVQLRLVEIEAAISALRSQLQRARKDLTRMQAQARAAPQVAAEYQNLERGYNVILKNYNELLARRQASRLTEAADAEADKVRLRVVDPPTISGIPVQPSRFLLISAVLAVGLGAGIVLAIVLGQWDRSIWDLGRLGELGQPVLGGISIRPSAIERRTLYPQAAGVTIAVLTLIAVYGGLLSASAVTTKVLL